MFLMADLSLHGFNGINNELSLHLFEVLLQLLFTLTLPLRSFRDMIKESITRYNVALFIFAIFVSSVLDCIVGQLHEYLVFVWDFWVILLVFFRTRPYVGLSKDKHFSIIWVEDGPYSDVKLSIVVQQWLFY